MRPTAINLNRSEGYLEIVWEDNEVCRYPLSHLREACPCVECRGGHANMGATFAPDNILTLKPARSYDVENILPIGNYAITLVWDDGHQTGIYTWTYLRQICPPKSETEDATD
jgi:DUF971 family protein